MSSPRPNGFGMAEFLSPEGKAVWLPLLAALLIGLLIGAQREAARQPGGAGLRDFILVAMMGAICALLQLAGLTVASIAGIVVFVAVYQPRGNEGPGLTTSLSLLAVFLLAYLAGMPGFEEGLSVALGLTVLMGIFLNAKQSLRHFFRETITEIELNDSLRFLALIFVLYPLLPAGSYGPYEFFNPTQIWKFVILISSISFLGYFLEKFLGASTGLKLTSLLGGLASTTAATTAFTKEVKAAPQREQTYWQAATIANAVQLPRVLVILLLVSPHLGQAAAAALLAGCIAGLAWSFVGRSTRRKEATEGPPLGLRNPFTIGPALKFGAVLAVVLFLTKMATAHFGPRALPLSSAIGGLLDVDAITLSVGDLFKLGAIEADAGVKAVVIALWANALFKTALTLGSGHWRFVRHVALSLAVMLGTTTVVMFVF